MSLGLTVSGGILIFFAFVFFFWGNYWRKRAKRETFEGGDLRFLYGIIGPVFALLFLATAILLFIGGLVAYAYGV
jgi:hypothetical protein